MIINPEDRQHLMNIVDAIDQINGYVQGMDFDDFSKDEFTREEVARHFTDIGGAAKLLSQEFTSNYGDVDWETLIRLEDAMYDQSVEHGFIDIWNIIKNDFPIFKDQFTDIASNADSEEDIEGTTIEVDRKLNEEQSREEA